MLAASTHHPTDQPTHLKNGVLTERYKALKLSLLASQLHGVQEVSPRFSYLRLVPLPQSVLLHLKVDPLDSSALPEDLNAAHVLLKVLHQLLCIRTGLEPLETKVFGKVVGKMDDQDTQVEPDAGSWLVETLREFQVVELTVIVEVCTLH